MKLIEIHRVSLSNDPEEMGATITLRGNDLEQILNVPISRIETFEGSDKTAKGFANDESEENIGKMISMIRKGKKLPPILVRKIGFLKYQVIDGHHRFEVYKRLGYKTVEVQIVRTINVNEI